MLSMALLLTFKRMNTCALAAATNGVCTGGLTSHSPTPQRYAPRSHLSTRLSGKDDNGGPATLNLYLVCSSYALFRFVPHFSQSIMHHVHIHCRQPRRAEWHAEPAKRSEFPVVDLQFVRAISYHQQRLRRRRQPRHFEASPDVGAPVPPGNSNGQATPPAGKIFYET